ncbi:MAG: hypothetical protein Q8M16_07315, partial [Pirellulaceae bacterium]|nr:hypothetical protein [Pirellulaceae bacterium]
MAIWSTLFIAFMQLVASISSANEFQEMDEPRIQEVDIRRASEHLTDQRIFDWSESQLGIVRELGGVVSLDPNGVTTGSSVPISSNTERFQRLCEIATAEQQIMLLQLVLKSYYSNNALSHFEIREGDPRVIGAVWLNPELANRLSVSSNQKNAANRFIEDIKKLPEVFDEQRAERLQAFHEEWQAELEAELIPAQMQMFRYATGKPFKLPNEIQQLLSFVFYESHSPAGPLFYLPANQRFRLQLSQVDHLTMMLASEPHLDFSLPWVSVLAILNMAQIQEELELSDR